MANDTPESIRCALAEARCILILSHIRPDGDAVGSMLGLGLALSQAGKDVQMVLADGMPSRYRFLKGSEKISKKVDHPYEYCIVVDAGDVQRTGNILGERVPDLSIDHHITNTYFAHLNWVEPEAAATAAILAEQMPLWGLPVSTDIASALLTGVIVDTIGFRTSNTTSKTFRIAADLLDSGANLNDTYFYGLMQRSFKSAQYWGAGLTNLQKSNHMLWTSLTLKDRSRVSYPGNDDADLINILSTIDDIDIAMIFVEQKRGHVKVSWRAKPGFDISAIAVQFGGGGHPAAAGADIKGKLDEVRQKVLDATEVFLTEKRKNHKPFLKKVQMKYNKIIDTGERVNE